jgi:hypothetical protein
LPSTKATTTALPFDPPHRPALERANIIMMNLHESRFVDFF